MQPLFPSSPPFSLHEDSLFHSPLVGILDRRQRVTPAGQESIPCRAQKKKLSAGILPRKELPGDRLGFWEQTSIGGLCRIRNLNCATEKHLVDHGEEKPGPGETPPEEEALLSRSGRGSTLTARKGYVTENGTDRTFLFTAFILPHVRLGILYCRLTMPPVRPIYLCRLVVFGSLLPR